MQGTEVKHSCLHYSTLLSIDLNKKKPRGIFPPSVEKTPQTVHGMVRQFAWQITRKSVQGEHWGSAAGVVSWVDGHRPCQGSSDMVSTRTEAVSSVCIRKDMVTQMECPQKHTAIQFLGCKECQSGTALRGQQRKQLCEVQSGQQSAQPSGRAERSRKTKKYQELWGDWPVELHSIMH